jgi:hypothetical protein
MLGLFVAVTTATHAQQIRTLVVPNAMANVEGNIGNSFPFNIGSNTLRYQQVFASSQFGSMPPAGALITGIAFRADAGWSSFSGTLPAIRIDLSTTSKTPDRLDPIFANNVGANNVVVFNGPLSLSSAAAGHPAAFDIVITLAAPFFYTPSAGNLLMDVRNSGGGTIIQFDAVLGEGDSVSRGYGALNSATGSVDTVGLVTEFIFSSNLPGITNQPQSQTVTCMSNATFTVGAAGISTLLYQWRRNGMLLPGYSVPVCCHESLTVTNADPTVAGIYDVVITDNEGSVTSAPAMLTIVDTARYSLRISTQGTNATISWPLTCANYVLQEASNLTSSTTWVTLTNIPVVSGGSNRVTLPVLKGPKFYRLFFGGSPSSASVGRRRFRPYESARLWRDDLDIACEENSRARSRFRIF